MGSATRPAVYTIPAHRGFADALAAWLVERFGKGDRGLADGLILIPNNRAARALTEAFVRGAGGGLLLPRMAAIGDLDLDEALGNALAPIGQDADIPRAVDALQRRLTLARLLAEDMQTGGEAIGAGEAIRIAGELGRALDQLTFERLSIADVAALGDAVAADLSGHWARAYARFLRVAEGWAEHLRADGLIDAAERRNRLLGLVASRWRETPPGGFVVAAGITTSAPAVTDLLGTVARMEGGMVVLPHFDHTLDAASWDRIAPRGESGGRDGDGALETHPQYHLRLVLEGMRVAPEEVMLWPRLGEGAAPSNRARVITTAFAPAQETADWIDVPGPLRSLAGVRLLEARHSGEEAMAIAVLVREAMETPGRRVAIVTPDRELALRISAALARWTIAADDSAGQSLATLAPGTLLLALLRAAAADFAPVELLALLKHPLVRAGEGRAAWLGAVRALDLALRGPRPAPGLSALDAVVAARSARDADVDLPAMWAEARPVLELVSTPFATLAAALPPVTEALERLSGGAVWRGEAGRSLAALLADVATHAAASPPPGDAADLVEVMRTLLAAVAIRPGYGGHPRVAIYGLLEARLQQADLIICAGLNEGTWPGLPGPDPWLAPMVRRQLGLPSLERSIGLAAHDLAGALGAPEVVLTRAIRERGGPATASRFLLRLTALAGENLARETRALDLSRTLDAPRVFSPAERPRPRPPAEARKVALSVTAFDRLKADPYAFYARSILRLGALDPIDAEPSAAWRGTLVHAVLERWAVDDGCRPDLLLPRADAMLADLAAHPLLRTLWRDRLRSAFEWLSAQSAALAAAGRLPAAIEQKGTVDLRGITLTGKADRIDREATGALIIVDYKSGKAPSNKQVAAGFALQLGLLGLIAEQGGIAGVAGSAAGFEYWSLARSGDRFGKVSSPVAGTGAKIAAEDFVRTATAMAGEAIDNWILGTAPFTAKLHPAFAPYTEYDQLMRLQEWAARPEQAA